MSLDKEMRMPGQPIEESVVTITPLDRGPNLVKGTNGPDFHKGD